MEALTSDRALDEAINEGSFGSYKNLPKSSLPHSKKKHIYEGIDISAITREILKIPQSNFTSRQYSMSMKLLTQPATAARSKRCSEEEVLKESGIQANAKYRHFVETKNNADKFGRLPNLAPRHSEIPTNYNNFVSSEFERSRLQASKYTRSDINGRNGKSPTVIRCSEDLKESEISETYPTIEKLIVHIDDVKRMMGRKNGTKSKKVQRRSNSRKAPSDTSRLCESASPASITPSPCKSRGFSRYNTVLEHYPDLVTGRDVMGFSRNWPRTDIKVSVTTPIRVLKVQDSPALPLVDIRPPR